MKDLVEGFANQSSVAAIAPPSSWQSPEATTANPTRSSPHSYIRSAIAWSVTAVQEKSDRILMGIEEFCANMKL